MSDSLFYNRSSIAEVRMGPEERILPLRAFGDNTGKTPDTTNHNTQVQQVSTISRKYKFESLYVWNIVAVLGHFGSFLAIAMQFAQINREDVMLDGDITVDSVCWSGSAVENTLQFHNEPQGVWDRRTYLFYLVEAFFLLSASFQSYHVVNKEHYRAVVENNLVQSVRYWEYSLSASCMFVAISVVLFVNSFYFHVLIFVCSFCCMQFGLVADHIRVLTTKLIKSGAIMLSDDSAYLFHITNYAHAVGWIPVLLPYSVLVVHYYFTSTLDWQCLANTPNVETVPWFVTLIVFSQFFLFCSFGFVQILQLRSEHKLPSQILTKEGASNVIANIGMAAEWRFIFLSLTAKLLLGWLIAAQVLFA